MITAQKAYSILSKDYPAHKILGCLDFGSFFVFSLCPLDKISDETYYTGTIMDAVDKKTGKTFKYDLTDNIEAYQNAKEVEVNDVFRQKI